MIAFKRIIYLNKGNCVKISEQNLTSSSYPQATYIVPCFNEEENIIPFFEEFEATFSNAEINWQLLFIDDGSTDNTFQKLSDLSKTTNRVRAISFSRNFGKEAAIWAGLNNSNAEFVGIIDADLQQPPQDARAMTEFLLSHEEYDSVAAFQEHRHEKGLRSKLHKSFYGLLSNLSGMKVIQDASDFRVFRRNVADAMLSLPESCRFTKGIFAWIGFNTFAYPYTPRDRTAGSSKWSFFALLKYAIEGAIGFSTKPLHFVTILGFLTSTGAIIYFLIILFGTLIFGIDVPGYATTIGVVLLLGGIELLVTGVLGEYLARVYLEGKHRPIYIEKRRIEPAVKREPEANDPTQQ